MASAIVVADTSVIINFLRIDRMDLIGRYPEPFIATDHVAVEIADAYPEQQARYTAALSAGYISEESVSEPNEVELFLQLGKGGRLGAGERSAIAVALRRTCTLAIDDSRALKRAIREAGLLGHSLHSIGTQDIVLCLIHASALTIREADVIKDTWANHHRFRLKIATFRDLL